MHIDKIRRLAGWMAQANLTTLAFKEQGFELRLVRNASGYPSPVASPAQVPPRADETVRPAVAAMATLCGHFHARHPGREQPQVSAGQALTVGDTVGVIAVGPLLLPVTVHTAGIAGHYLVEDGTLVDYATPLLALAGA